MRLLRTKHFVREYSKAPKAIQRAFDKQLIFLLQDLHHPSLRAKKYDEARNLWQARVNRNWRFYFTVYEDAYVITSIIAHPK